FQKQINQGLFGNKSTKQIKKICKDKIDSFGKQIESLGLDFIFEKNNRKYIEIGNNNKLITFKVWYKSVFTNIPSFVKIQINFLEKIEFDINTKNTLTLIKENISNEEKIYFKEFITFYQNKKLFVYDIREIVAEKIRSLLTRRAIKSRDAIDLMFIYQKYKINPEELIKEAKEKIEFAMKYYEKYKENFISTKEKIDKISFHYDEVRHLVIKDFKREEFEGFIKNLFPLLYKILKEIS
ncbi:MAG: nucleotidyl transferase AbiEii/AbiGii toxin family protein, partial [Candidatus Pacearchaeota archaeon]|nr:nucleotidyl transferase AbiEii/AbiGii toxin family protein [Candidatus Pacearchaeota archaeon]